MFNPSSSDFLSFEVQAHTGRSPLPIYLFKTCEVNTYFPTMVDKVVLKIVTTNATAITDTMLFEHGLKWYSIAEFIEKPHILTQIVNYIDPSDEEDVAIIDSLKYQWEVRVENGKFSINFSIFRQRG